MKIAIVGGGASGVAASIFIKRDHPDYDVCIFESNDKLLKKIYATGNGKCNFANKGDLANKYDNEDFALPIIKDFSVFKMVTFFASMGIHTKAINDLLYPISESSETVAIMLLREIDRLGIKVVTSYKVQEYEVKDDKVIIGNESFDKVIFASGGKSSPQLGTDGNLFSVFEKHGYKLKEMSPSLCPVKVKENVKRLDGIRTKVELAIVQNGKGIYCDTGELLFKKDGLSGIVVFNASHYINTLEDKNNVEIHVNFAYNNPIYSPSEYIEYVKPQLADYLSYHHLDINDTVFTFDGMYDYQYSQVTSGGLHLSNLNNDLSSKIEKNIYFIGEMVDVSAACGGYNLLWAVASAFAATKNF